MSRLLLSCVLAVLLVSVASQGQPQPPGEGQGGQVPVINELAGAWVICAASYTGPDAPELARQLVEEIRGRWKMPAYIFNRGAEERRRYQEELDRAQQQTSLIPGLRRRRIRVDEQIAVLVGGYPNMESARKALETIKKLPVPQLKLASGRPALDTMFVVREQVEKPQSKGLFVTQVNHTPPAVVQQEKINPFQTAFVTPNPTLPPGQQGPRVDPLWWKLNEGNEYSLLECQKPWTLVVKQYSGAKSLVSQETTGSSFLGKMIPGGNKAGEALDAGARTAVSLAKTLRQLNFSAYVLHTRTSSFVTIGGFNGPNDPDLQRVRQQLAALQQQFNTYHSDPFMLYPNPVPMEVPRQQ